MQATQPSEQTRPAGQVPMKEDKTKGKAEAVDTEQTWDKQQKLQQQQYQQQQQGKGISEQQGQQIPMKEKGQQQQGVKQGQQYGQGIQQGQQYGQGVQQGQQFGQGVQQGQQYGQGVQQGQMQSEKKEELWGMKFKCQDLEVKDITCTLKMNEKLNSQQRFLLANMFVEFADIDNPDEVRNKQLPKWPMDHPWFSLGHVPLQEKRTFRFRALLDIFLKYIFQFDEFKDCNDEIGVIDYVGLISDNIETFRLKKSNIC